MMTTRYLMVYVCLFSAFLAIAQEKNENQLYDISETFTVSAATVEVVVTNKKGERITGLSKEDLRLTVDGKPVDTYYFSEIRSVEAEQTSLPSNGEGETAEAPNADHVVSTASVPRNYLAFVDDYHTHRHYRAQLFENLVANIDAMRPGDSMAIVRYTGGAPTLYTSWTDDRAKLYDILVEIEGNKPEDMRRRAVLSAGDFEESELIRGIPDADADSNAFSASGMRESQDFENSATDFDEENDWSTSGMVGMSAFRRVQHLERMVTKTAMSVELAMRGLPQRDGRKILVLTSSGWPYQFRKYLGLKYANLPGHKDGGEWLLRPITDTANLLGYTIYPMLIGQISAGIFTGKESPTFADFNANTNFEVKHDSLQFLAEQTGGKLLSKAQFFDKPLTEVANDNHQYYVLGFSTTGLTGGERHSIKVQANNAAYKVRHRQEFRARTQEEQGDMEMESIILTGEKMTQLAVALGEPTREKRNLMVPVTIDIPMSWASLKQHGSEQVQGRFTLRVSAEDKRGNRADLVRAPIDLIVHKNQAEGKIPYDATLLLRKKKQRLVFSLRDETGGRTLTSTMKFSP